MGKYGYGGLAMNDDTCLHLNVDLEAIKNNEDYHAVWDRIHPVEIRMIEKNEHCKHELGDSFILKHHYDHPEEICHALMHVLSLYVWRASMGFPSWEDDPSVFRIHCPDKKGTVWEVRRAEIGK